jgi:hypothetical protein
MIIPYGYWITKVIRLEPLVQSSGGSISSKYMPFFDCLKKEEVCVRQQMLKIMMDGSKQINKKKPLLFKGESTHLNNNSKKNK